MMEMGLGFLMERMRPISRNILWLLKLRVQGIIHSCKAAANFHMKKTGDLSYQRFQLGCNELDGCILVNILFQLIGNNMLHHFATSNLVVCSGAAGEQMEEMGFGFRVQGVIGIDRQCFGIL